MVAKSIVQYHIYHYNLLDTDKTLSRFYTNDGVVGETHMNNKKTKQVTINEVRDLFNFNDTLKYCVNLKENSPQVPFDS